MKEAYLAYFDFMGFKEFVYNNEDEVLMRRMGHIYRDIESSLGRGKNQKPSNGVVMADLSESKLNCLNILFGERMSLAPRNAYSVLLSPFG